MEKTYTILAQTSKISSPKWSNPKWKAVCHPAGRMRIKVVKAWAVKAYAHLGRIWSKSTLAIHLRLMAASDPRNNKTGTSTSSPNPKNIFFFLSRLSPEMTVSGATWWPVAPSQRSGGAVARPLTGVRCSPEGEHAIVEPSRGTSLAEILSWSTLGWCRRAVKLGAPFPVSGSLGKSRVLTLRVGFQMGISLLRFGSFSI
jgi:hypothetical protein